MTLQLRTQAKIIRWLNTGIFPVTILFSCGFTYDELMKELKKLKATDWHASLSQDKHLIDGGSYFALYRNVEGVHYYHIILVKPFDFSDDDMCKLAHEVLHICQFMMPTILDMEREYECVAYTHTHIMRQCLEELRKVSNPKH